RHACLTRATEDGVTEGPGRGSARGVDVVTAERPVRAVGGAGDDAGQVGGEVRDDRAAHRLQDLEGGYRLEELAPDLVEGEEPPRLGARRRGKGRARIEA